MPILDQWRTMGDNETLSAGDSIKFDLTAFCLPFATPSAAEVMAAFDATSITITSVSSDFWSTLGTEATLGSGGTLKATVREVITVGQLRAQILTAGNVLNNTKSVPCSDFTVVNGEVDILTQLGTGIDAPSSTSFGLSLGLLAAGVIAIVLLAFYRDLRV